MSSLSIQEILKEIEDFLATAGDLVVIDEFGYPQLNREESNLFFRVVNYRYAKGSSTAITTNKGIASWPSVLADDEVLAGAILDRLLHRATVLNIQGRPIDFGEEAD